jgi:hypothetical protein
MGTAAAGVMWRPETQQLLFGTIWDFRAALEVILNTIKQCSPLKTNDRIIKLKAIIGRTGAAFSTAKEVRIQAAHPVEKMKNAHERRVNKLRDSSLHIRNSMINRSVCYSHNGRLISFEMTTASLEKLKELRNSAFSVFRE